MTKIKGHQIYSNKEYIFKQYGEDTYEKVVRNIKDKEIQDILLQPIMANDWYELKVFNAYLLALSDTIGKDNYEKAAVEVAKKNFSGIFGFVVQFISVQKFFSVAENKVTNQIMPSKLKVEKNSENMYTLHFEIPESSMLFMKGIEIIGRVILEIISKKNVKSSLKVVKPYIFDIIYVIES